MNTRPAEYARLLASLDQELEERDEQAKEAFSALIRPREPKPPQQPRQEAPPLAAGSGEEALRAEVARLLSEASAEHSAELLATEQRKTAAEVHYAKRSAAIRAGAAAARLERSLASSKRALANLKEPYDRMVESGFDIVACAAFRAAYETENTAHLYETGRSLTRELAVLAAQRLIDENPACVDTLACYGVLFGGVPTVTFPGDFGPTLARAHEELCRGYRPIQARDAIVALEAKIAEIASRQSPRMDPAAARERWEILKLCAPDDHEAALIQTHDAEIARPRIEANEQRTLTIRAARSGDEQAMAEVNAWEGGLQRIANLSAELFGPIGHRFAQAVGRAFEIGRLTIGSNASVMGGGS